jgi:hypothetical protein
MIPAPILPYVVGAAALAAAAGLWIWRWRRLSPAEKERRRRIGIGRLGRMADGEVTDAHDGVLYYSYSVRGVQYTTSQDVSALLGRLPAAPAMLMGTVTVKYLSKNPANSIVISEEWSGFRQR